MGIIQQLDPMWACAAGIAAICAFALVRFVWRHRIRNAAVVLLAAALAFTAIPKSNRQANGRAGSPLPAATTRDVSVETPHITAISVSTSGVDLVLYRPAFDSVSAVEVTVAAKTNKVILHEGSRVGAALDGVQTVELAPYSSRRILYYVEGCSPSEAVHDVLLAAQITDGGETCSSEASMTVGCVGLTAEYEVPSNRTRHVFGPAEPTRLSVVPQALLASFEVVGQIPHGGVVRNDDNTYTINVSDRRSRFELGARHGNALLRLPFSVIEPERKFRAVKGRAIDADSWFSTTGDKPPPRVGQIGVGLYVELFLEPSYVSFKSLGTMELSCPATKLTGDFRGIAELYPGFLDHSIAAGAENGGELANLVDDGNCAGSDVASYVDRERMLAGKKGGFSWIIPSVWYTWNHTYTGRLETVEQRFELEENGDMKVTKYGFWAKRAISGMVSPKVESTGH